MSIQTRDGVPIAPGMKLYGWKNIVQAMLSGGVSPISELTVRSVSSWGDWFAVEDPKWPRCGNNYYSTKEGAEAMRQRVLSGREDLSKPEKSQG